MRRVITTAVAATAAGTAALLGASTALAAPPDVTPISVTFVEHCPGSTDPIVNDLEGRRTVKTMPNGDVHYFLDLHGTVTNEVTGTVVRVRAARRFTDDEANNASTFAGLQVRFSSGGSGVLHLNAGRATGPLSEVMTQWTDFQGRWDGLAAGLPPSVCRVLVGR